ncbi:variable surface protein [Plasmodium gonderi]|uniref:Variable surface protein n=1 Tax=Plasmodium gonderi TaxID=77519 RepID=A0A1Y1JNG7_PLAGO|nr:variable surface protein [Plasmodium gonderi]GAW84029.1 variable surface protein [Plasmodium gonderi]
MKGLYKILALTGSLFVLSSCFLSNGVSTSETKKRRTGRIPCTIADLDAEGVYSVSEWKKKKWTEFMALLENDFKEFNDYLEKEKNKWIKEIDNALEQWKKDTEKKWDEYDEATFNELLGHKAQDALNWSDKEWTNWISKNGRLAIKADWNKWIEECENSFKVGISDDWEKWSSFKKREYDITEWKFLEDIFWPHWKRHVKPEEPLYDIKINMMEKWQDRIKGEEEEWSNWIEDKKQKYIDVEWDKWTQWKKDNNMKFIDVMESIVKKWTDNKHWNVWHVKNIHVVKYIYTFLIN